MTDRPSAQRHAILFYRIFVVFAVAAFFIGVILRYQFICIDNRPSNPDNILGDAAWYVHHAVNTFEPGYQPTMYDTLFPPGASMFYYVLRTFDGSFRLVDIVMWVLASLVPVILSATAWRLYGARVAWFVLAFASLYFPLWEYFGYLISEGPFIFTLVLTFHLLVLSLEAETARSSIVWAFFAGIVLGACAVTKSCALVTAAFIAFALLWGQRKRRFRVWPTFFAAAVGVVLVIAPVSIRATRLNEGRFLLIANDSPRTFLLGHQGRAGLTWWYDAERNFRMNFINPSTQQHGYHEERSYPFGVYETGPNYAAGLAWVKENPLEALLLSIEHVFDMFATALPWPGYFRPYVGWTIFFHQMFIAALLIPVAIFVSKHPREIFAGTPEHLSDLVLLSAVLSIYVLAFFFVGEGRYRICYDGFMIILCGRALFPLDEYRRPFVRSILKMEPVDARR